MRHRKNIFPLTALVVLCLLSVLAMTLALLGTAPPGFVPPAFEAQAVSGLPEVPPEHWSQVSGGSLGFSVHVCGQFPVRDGAAQLWFCNDSSNTVWMKVRILDAQNGILGESGLLRPGEYVQWVMLCRIPQSGERLALKIMAYEPDTYHSAGTVTLYTVSP